MKLQIKFPRLLAPALRSSLSDRNSHRGQAGVFFSQVNKEQLEQVTRYLSETRWIEYAKQWPEHRVFVEAVLGREIDWSAP